MARLVDGLLGGGEADPRPRHDRDRLSGLRPRATRRTALVRARGGRGRSRGPGARVLAVSRRGATRVPALDARAPADRALARLSDLGTARSRCSGRPGGDLRTHAALRPVRGLRARAALDRLAVRTCPALAVGLEPVGLGGRSDPRRRSRARVLRRHGPCVDRLARDDVHLQGPHLRACELGDGRARDRHRRPSRPGRDRGACATQVGGARPAHARLRRDERRGADRLHRLCGHQGRVQLDGLLDAHRRAEPDLPLPRSLRSDGARLRARRRSRLGNRRCRGVHGLRRHRRAAAPRPVPVLRGARALDRGVREPGARVGRGHDRGGADRRLRRRAPRRARARSCCGAARSATRRSRGRRRSSSSPGA